MIKKIDEVTHPSIKYYVFEVHTDEGSFEIEIHDETEVHIVWAGLETQMIDGYYDKRFFNYDEAKKLLDEKKINYNNYFWTQKKGPDDIIANEFYTATKDDWEFSIKDSILYGSCGDSWPSDRSGWYYPMDFYQLYMFEDGKKYNAEIV